MTISDRLQCRLLVPIYPHAFFLFVLFDPILYLSDKIPIYIFWPSSTFHNYPKHANNPSFPDLPPASIWYFYKWIVRFSGCLVSSSHFLMMLLLLIIFGCVVIVLSSNKNLTSSGNYKCADVYCINLDTYSKLDVPTNPIQVRIIIFLNLINML